LQHSIIERINTALRKGSQFLVAQQSAEGAWRSDVYGQFKDGTALTPLVLQALDDLTAQDPAVAASYTKGIAYLAGFARADSSIDEGPHGLSYPVYTAALTTIVLSQPPNADRRKARDAWLRYLRERQLTEALGWEPTDQEFGGWGFAGTVPRKPGPGELRPSLLESNLSATVCALEALRSAGVTEKEPANALTYLRVLTFLGRCQNFSPDPKKGESTFDDGGFFFIYGDPVRNKAGPAGKDKMGRERFHSYGSMTADGIRALLACGRPVDDTRVAAARRWLEEHFQTDAHPGAFTPENEPRRDAVYFYYCNSAARAFHTLGIQQVQTPRGRVSWATELAEALLRRQQADGSWVNDVRAQREDDPVVATALALGALEVCRSSLLSR
jgi:squalene-hopene/tetraprenyl-beta-curcumene cyclase